MTDNFKVLVLAAVVMVVMAIVVPVYALDS